MLTSFLHILFVATLACFVTSSVQAQTLGFLKHTPITYLRDKDNASLEKTAVDVLDNKKDGESVDWTNQGLGNPVRINAEVNAMNTENTDDKVCRKLTIVLHAKGQDQALTLKICKAESGSGKWAIEKTRMPLSQP